MRNINLNAGCQTGRCQSATRQNTVYQRYGRQSSGCQDSRQQNEDCPNMNDYDNNCHSNSCHTMNCHADNCHMDGCNPSSSRYSDPLCGMPVGMGYVPWQQWSNIYEPAKALNQGTLFPPLDLPFLGCVPRGYCKNKGGSR